jgi:16S rRNA (cytidine1402-2'-O)-methyltransferase
MPGKLYLVATPIGNLGDMTQRALSTLSSVSFIACEDTRRTRSLLSHFGISKPLVSLPAFAEGKRAEPLLERIMAGEDAALVTDAGTPAISDPGEKLVALAVQEGIDVVPIPGASAVVAALCASGLPTHRFYFLGFLPRQASARQSMLKEAVAVPATLVFYESTRRLAETLADLAEALGGARRACVGRELTKIHEEFVRGTLAELVERYRDKEVLGESVVMVEGPGEKAVWSASQLKEALAAELASGKKLKAASVELSRASGWSGQEVYREGLALKQQGEPPDE